MPKQGLDKDGTSRHTNLETNLTKHLPRQGTISNQRILRMSEIVFPGEEPLLIIQSPVASRRVVDIQVAL